MVLVNQDLAMQNTNKSIRETFNHEGFYIFKSLLSYGDIVAITQSIHQLFLKQLHFLNINNSECNASLDTSIKTLFDANIERYIQTISACSRIDTLQRVFYSEKIKQALEALNYKETLIPTSPVFHIMSSSLKIPNGYYGLDAHQDWPSMQGSLDSVIFWLPLVDISEDLNPVEVLPKSHLLGVLPSELGKNEAVVKSSSIQEENFVAVEANRGDLVTFSSFLVHRSSHKSNGGIRIACSLRYENLNDPTFIERGFPTAYRRSVERENLGFMPTNSLIRKVYQR